MMIQRRERIDMLILKDPVVSRRSKKLNKEGIALSLTPGIVAWCDEMSQTEEIFRSQWIEEAVLDCCKSKSIVNGLMALQDGAGKSLKCNKNRWGEGKKRCTVYLRASTIEILQELSDKTSVSKSECVEYILRAIADTTRA